jgi:aminopeptidase N
VGSLVTKLAAATSANKRDDIALFTTDGKAPKWALRGNISRWKVSALRLPGATEEYAIVFHDFNICESTYDHIHRIAKGGGDWKLGEEIPETESFGFRIRDHKLVVNIDPKTKSLTAKDKLSFERVEGNAKVCIMRLSSDMSIDKATLGGKPAVIETVPGVIAFSAPAGKKFTLDVDYHGTVSHPGSDYINDKEAVLTSYFYPHIGRLPATHTTTTTVPKGWTVVAQGEQTAHTETSDTVTTTFRMDVPNCYFTLDAAPYVITKRVVDGRTLSAYFLKDRPEAAKKVIDDLAASIKFFEARFGKYPFSHYEAVETAGPFGGALEAYSFSTYGPGMFGAVAHEVAHTWFGGIVPNTYTGSMWNESFASWADEMMQRTVAGKQSPALKNARGSDATGARLRRGYAVPINEARNTMSGSEGAVGYGKGAQVLSMLEDILGNEKMIQCAKRFVDDRPKGEKVEWSHFAKAVKDVTGEDYGWFFEQWLERGGVPLLGFDKAEVIAESDGFTVDGIVSQDSPAYKLKLTIRVVSEDGTKADMTVDPAGAAQPFRIKVKSKPVSMEIDPDGNLLLAAKDGQTLKKDLKK